jgi:hypothetical protein
VKVTLHRGGSATVSQLGRQARVERGGLVALDTRHPYRLRVAQHCDVVVLALPRHLLGSHAERRSDGR